MTRKVTMRRGGIRYDATQTGVFINGPGGRHLRGYYEALGWEVGA